MYRVIISAERAELTPSVNKVNTDKLRQTLEHSGLYHMQVKGVYKGSSEVSFYVELSDNDLKLVYLLMTYICKVYNQECFLLIDSHNNASLVDRNGKYEAIGKFQRVTRDKALTMDNYTQAGNNHFYAVIDA